MAVNVFDRLDAQEFIAKWRGNSREVLEAEVAKTGTEMTMQQLDELADLIDASVRAGTVHMVDYYVVPHHGLSPYLTYMGGFGCDWLGKVESLLNQSVLVLE